MILSDVENQTAYPSFGVSRNNVLENWKLREPSCVYVGMELLHESDFAVTQARDDSRRI